MYSTSNIFPELKGFGLCKTICLVEIGELLCLYNVTFVSPFLVHSLSIISKNYMIRNKEITEAMFSNCLNPTLKDMDVSIYPIIRLTTLFVYILLIA